MMCKACLEDNKIRTTTTFTVDYGKCVIVMRNVPCSECQICGEVTFSDEVSARLEQIVNAKKNHLQNVSVIEFSSATGNTSIYDEPNRSHLRIAMNELNAGHGKEHRLLD